MEKVTKGRLGNVLEFYSNEIAKQLFVAILGREADEAGLRSYKAAIVDHRSLIPAIQGLLGSGEFSAKAVALAAPEIVDALYLSIMDRETDADGRKNCIDLIQSGTGLTEVIRSLSDAFSTSKCLQGGKVSDPIPIHWVHNQLHRWENGLDAARYTSFCEDIAKKEQTIHNFIVDSQEVSVLHKDVSTGTIGEERIKSLLNYLRAISPDLDLKKRLILPICINDAANEDVLEYPVFSFDKLRGSEKILIPDADYLMSDGYQSLLIEDPVPFSNKQPKAVFAGATTGAGGNGGALLTLHKVKNDLVPRISSAQFFASSEDVDFKITSICQEDGAETVEYIKSLGICDEFWSWEKQLDYKFIISMDGNGAAWGRMVKSLHSNSVLMKYESQRVQFYYDSLVPWLHYIPIARDADVVDIVKKELEEPGRYEYIAKAGSEFAKEYLRKEVVDSYMIHLLKSFACLMR
ncbi:MAG: glycosyl transferase family 90 [Chthoniobacterales bacterium]